MNCCDCIKKQDCNKCIGIDTECNCLLWNKQNNIKLNYEKVEKYWEIVLD